MLADILRLLQAHSPADVAEAAHLDRALTLARTTPEPHLRANMAGHFTASSALIDPATNRMAFIWHAKLGRWLQPGGHIEPSDASPADAAWRELLEETGLPASQIRLRSSALFDMDVHPIPARADEPAHWHYDLRFLFALVDPVDSRVENGIAWHTVETVAGWADPSLSRMAAKISAARRVQSSNT